MVKRLVLRVTAAILVGLVLVAAVLLAATQTGPGRAMVAAAVSRLASSPQQGVQVRDLEGLLSGRLRVGTVTLGDAQGPWLELDGVSADWSPLALLRGELLVHRLAVDSVALQRPPPPSTEAGDPAADGFSLPLSVRIAEIAVRRIAIAEAVAGAAFELRAAGSARISTEPLALALDLSVERDDDVAGAARAVIDFAPANNTLALDITVAEPPGGALAGLLRLPGNPAVDLAVKGTGPISDWSARIALDLDDRRMLEGGARLTETGDGIAGQIDLKGRLADLAPARLAPLLAGDSVLTAGAVRGHDGSVRIEGLRLTSDTTQVTLDAAVDPAGGALRLQARATISEQAGWIEAGSPASPLRVRAPSLTVRAQGETDDADWQVELSASALETGFGSSGPVSVSATGSGTDMAARTGPFALEANFDGLVLEQPEAARLANGPLTVKAAGTLEGTIVRLQQADLAASALAGSAAGWFDSATGGFAATVKADAAWPLDRAPWPGAADERITLSGEVSGDGKGGLAAKELSMAAGPLTARIEGTMAGQRIEASVDARLAELAAFDPRLGGSLAVTATLSGPIEGPAVELAASGTDVRLEGRALQDPRIRIEGVASPRAPSGTLEVSGKLADQPIAGAARVETGADGVIRIEDLSFELAGTTLAGALAIGPGGVPAGTLQITAGDLEAIAPLLLVPVAGSLEAKAELIEEDGRLKIVANGAAPDLRYGETAIQQAGFSVVIEDSLGTPAIDGGLTVESLRSSGTGVTGLVLKASKPQDGQTRAATRFELDAVADGIPLAASGLVRLDGPATRVRLETASAQYKSLQPRLSAPAEFTVSGNSVAFEQALIAVGGGAVRLSGSAGPSLALDAELRAVPMAMLEAFVPGTGAGGTLSGTVTVTGPPGAPVVGYAATWSGATAAALNSAGVPPLRLAVKGQFKDRIAVFSGEVDGYPGLAVSASGKAAALGNGELDVTIAGTLPLTLLDNQLASEGRRLTGTARLDMTVRGPFGKPVASGTLSASDATFVDSRSSIVVRSIALDAELEPGRIVLKSFNGTLSTGGRISAEGTIGLDAGGTLPADIKVSVRDGKYSDGKTLSAEFEADLVLGGALGGTATLGGSVTLGRVDVTIPEKLPSSIARLDVEHRGAPAAVMEQSEAMQPRGSGRRSGGGSTLELDIAVAARRQIFVRGRGIDAELGGELTLRGPASAPRAVGRFTMRRGRLDILTRRFTFSRGNIGFSGSLEPELDFAADTQVSGTTITVLVTGRPANPKITLSSDSGLADEDILALLLFGEGLSDISPLQAAQLAKAVATLGGIGGSYSVMDRVRNAFGLSDLDVAVDEEGEAKVTIGRQLNDKVYIGVEQGTGKSSGRVKIDIDISKNLKARGEVGADGKSKAGIFFERDY